MNRTPYDPQQPLHIGVIDEGGAVEQLRTRNPGQGTPLLTRDEVSVDQRRSALVKIEDSPHGIDRVVVVGVAYCALTGPRIPFPPRRRGHLAPGVLRRGVGDEPQRGIVSLAQEQHLLRARVPDRHVGIVQDVGVLGTEEVVTIALSCQLGPCAGLHAGRELTERGGFRPPGLHRPDKADPEDDSDQRRPHAGVTPRLPGSGLSRRNIDTHDSPLLK